MTTNCVETSPGSAAGPPPDGGPPTPDPEHPIGTLIIVAIYGLLFLVGWLAVYFGLFLPRGPVGS